MPSAISDTVPTPLPYLAGQVINLKGSDGEDICVTVTEVYSVTMSPVMEVQLQTKGGPQNVILKLYDRRFGDARIFSRYDPYDEGFTHTRRSEVAWEDYVRRGMAQALLHELKRYYDDEYGCCSYHNPLSDKGIGDWKTKNDGEKLGQRETIVYHKVEKKYTKEVNAYHQLQVLQGRCVPRFISSVTLDFPFAPPDLPPTYFQARGILLEKIRGFNLENLLLNTAKDPSLWKRIVQNAVDATKEVNRTGVLNFDSQPRNVVVATLDDHTFQPFVIDFGESICRDNWACHGNRDQESHRI
ncbi:hypothetical protein DL771_004092 [Monosporascus sp. 5C6A]|nr:hypothetical protein DL771_004092 [Monosporascus sp. 5C6A]